MDLNEDLKLFFIVNVQVTWYPCQLRVSFEWNFMCKLELKVLLMSLLSKCLMMDTVTLKGCILGFRLKYTFQHFLP